MADIFEARTILFPNSIHEGAKEALVPRPRGRAIRIRCWLLDLSEDTAPGCLDIRHCGSINSISDHQDYRSSTVSGVQREICRKSSQVAE